MPITPKLAKDYASFMKQTDALLSLLADVQNLESKYQRLIAEVAIIRLAYIMDNTLEIVFTKILAGANYIDGTAPILLYRAGNINQAKIALHQHGRKRPLNFLSWSDSKTCADMVKHTIDATDHCFSAINVHASSIKEIKDVRHYVAHQSLFARQKYKIILRRYYGAMIRTIPVGQFLISKRIRTRPTPIQSYVLAIRVFIKDLVRA